MHYLNTISIKKKMSTKIVNRKDQYEIANTSIVSVVGVGCWLHAATPFC